MEIYKYEPHHGAVLSRLIKECHDLNLVIKPAYNKNSYFLTIPEFHEDEKKYIGIFIKWSSKRFSPWRFSIYKSEQEELEIFEKDCKTAFLILACGNDGIACLNFSQLKEILDDNYEDVEWISAERRLRKEYAIKGTDGKLSKKIPRNLYPNKIRQELLDLRGSRKKSFFSWK